MAIWYTEVFFSGVHNLCLNPSQSQTKKVVLYQFGHNVQWEKWQVYKYEGEHILYRLTTSIDSVYLCIQKVCCYSCMQVYSQFLTFNWNLVFQQKKEILQNNTLCLEGKNEQNTITFYTAMSLIKSKNTFFVEVLNKH